MRKLPKMPMPPELRAPCEALALAVAATSVDGAKLHQGYVVEYDARGHVAVIMLEIIVRRTTRAAYLEERRRARPRKGDASPLAAGDTEGGK